MLKESHLIMKNNLLKAFFILLFLGTSIYSAQAFSFSSATASGQTLYYAILSDSTVAVTYPNHVGASYYSGYSMPVGNLLIPSSVTHSGSVYSVVSIDNNAFSGCAGLTALTIPNTVTAIGSSACLQCSSLVSVVIPVSVSTIGDNAFMGCSSLASVALPNSVTMIGIGTFQGCTSLASVTLGSAVTTIGNVAFDGCSSLTSFVIPDAVTMLGNWAFCNCTSLDTLYIGASISYLSQNIFSGCSHVRYLHYNSRNAVCYYYSAGSYHSALPVSALTQLVIGDSVQSVPQYAFADAPGLNAVTIGSHVSAIDANAFANSVNVKSLTYNTNLFSDASFPAASFAPMAGLEHLVVGSAVQHLPSRAFYGKTSLRSASFAASLNSIGDSCFYGCSALRGTLQLPAGLSQIGAAAFAGCSSLSGTIAFSSSLQSVGVAAFSNCDSILNLDASNYSGTIPDAAFSGCVRLYQALLGDNVSAIGSNAFGGCVRLAEIGLGASLSAIGSKAFNGCIRLVAPLFPETLSTIGDSAFYGCSLLGGDLSFPASVTAIGDYAFASIAPVSRLDMHCMLPPTIYAHTFASAAASTPVYVPCGATLSYHVTDYWDSFTNLQELPPFILSVSANNALMGSVSVLQQPVCSNYAAQIQAVANSGYHFLRWSDGITANPRSLLLSSDTAFTAVFVSDNSYIAVLTNDAARGTVSGSGIYTYGDTAIITAAAIGNNHFQRWHDGNAQNPRSVIVTQDSSFTAIFLSNVSTLTLASADLTMGSVSGGGTYTYLDQATIAATPAYGYHFTAWNDGVTSNPRLVTITQDTSFTASFAANTYNVVLASSSPAMGTVSGGGSYPYLASVTLTAAPALGHHFVQWSDGNTQNPRTMTVTADTLLTAQFAADIYLITALSNDTALGTVTGGGAYSYNASATLSATPAEGCSFIQWNDNDTANPRLVTVIGNAAYTAQFARNIYTVFVSSSDTAQGTVSGGGTYAHNTVITLTATPAEGCHFVQWNDGNTSNPRAVTVQQNAAYVAQFAVNTYALTVLSSDTAQGTVTGGGTYPHNAQATLAAIPSYGYHFIQWNDGNTSNPRIVTVDHNASYTAQFGPNSYTVAVAASNASAGTVSGSGAYTYLSQATLTAFPNPHYHFLCWNDSSAANPRTITVLSDTQLVACFQIDSHQVSVSVSDPAMGLTSGSGIYAYNTVISIAAIPNYGYHFTQWSDGVTVNPRTIAVASDSLFTAQFAANNYTAVVTTNDPSLGTVSGGGTFTYLTQLTLTATPLGNNRFIQWSDGVTANPRTLVLTSDTAITAQFAVNTCQLLCSSDNPEMGIVSGSGIYSYGTPVPIIATALSNCHFVTWSDGVTTNPRLVALTSDTVITAYFAGDTVYTITVFSNDSDMGTVSGSGQYYYAQQAVISAQPAPHHQFLYWSDGVTANPRTVSVIGDAEYTAVFQPTMYTVELSPNDEEFGAVYGAGQYAYQSQAVITAVPYPGFEFVRWSDGNAANPRTLAITSDVALQAIFAEPLGIDNPEGDDLVVTVVGRTIRLQQLHAHAVTLYDALGRIVCQRQLLGAGTDRLDLQVTFPGVYLLQLDGRPARKLLIP